MASWVKMKVTGVDQVLGRLRDMGHLGPGAVDETVRKLGREVLRRAVESMEEDEGPSRPGEPPHRHSGDLAASVRMVEKRSRHGIQVRVGSDRAEAVFTELGRANAWPRPWLYPAFKEASREAETLLMEVLRRVL